MKIHCLFCNSLIQINENDDQIQCKRCKAFALLNTEDFSFLNNINELQRENKLRRKMIDDENELLMYYQFTNKQLLQVLTKKQLESINKVLNKVNLNGVDRKRLHDLRIKIDKYKQLLKKIEFVKEFEYPE
ncbi:MAG: hypothetical protein EAX96_21185 [Candidatus Lokiarchaeota archaeon]|nr:hypothetical protein [Candidatus Lokiarchaeota archaeon]